MTFVIYVFPFLKISRYATACDDAYAIYDDKMSLPAADRSKASVNVVSIIISLLPVFSISSVSIKIF